MKTISRMVAVMWLAIPVAVAQAQQVPRYTIEDFLGTTSYSGASFSPDNGKLLVSHDGTGVFNAYAIPLDGGEPVPLTGSATNAIRAISYFPYDERFVYTSDGGGDELNHIYVQSPDGQVVDLTPGEGLRAQWMGWGPDRESFFIATNERDQRYFDVYRYSTAEGFPREMIYRNEDGVYPGSVSPDGRYIALTVVRTTSDNDLLLHDLATGERTNLTPHEGRAVSSADQDFSPDGRYLLYTTDDGSEFQHLVRYDLASGTRVTVLSPDWDVMYAYYSPGGRYLVAAINNDGRTELRLYDPATMERVRVTELPGANVTSVTFSRDESKMAMYASGSRFPSDVFVQDVATGDPPLQLTRSLSPAIDPAHLVDAEVVRFASFDGMEIPGILYRPHGASPDDRVPALVWVHGGPGGQSRVGYSGLIQYLVNHGYAVYAINNRGSSGYGKTFFAADDRRHGEADLGDVVASKDMLTRTGWVDPERVGIIGGSYGGYMVMAALAFAPDVFDVGVNIFGVTNWLRTLQSIPPWWEAQRQALYAELGDPSTDEERLRRISPLFHASNVTAPLIVLQGANDPRVLQVESDEIVAGVRANGVHVEYIVFPDEGHGFVRKENQLAGYRAIREFLDARLR